jgi:hypothetical protein
VREVLLEDHQVVIEHDEIEGLMPAMTMSFDVPEHALLEKLSAGQSIDFTVEATGKSYRVVEATVTGAAGGAGASGSFSDIAAARDPAPDFELVDQSGLKLGCRGHPMLTSSRGAPAHAPPSCARARFVSISLDPVATRRWPARIRPGARGGPRELVLLTGDPEIAQVLKAYGVGSMRRPDGQIDHLVATFLIDAEGNIAQRFIGLEHEPEELLRALERLSG